ncbi:uncharacterized protein TNCV_166591 [Trichonephila clavipes]|nr:uncharacterized protein TNCV_166591 [Trichonephila clavipes]
MELKRKVTVKHMTVWELYEKTMFLAECHHIRPFRREKKHESSRLPRCRVHVQCSQPCDCFKKYCAQVLQDALFICYKQSPDNAHSVALSERSSSPRLIEDETFNDSDIMNNLIDYEDGQEEPDSLRAKENMRGFSFPTNWKRIFLKYIPLRKEYKTPKGLQSCISGYHDLYKHLTTRPLSPKLISLFMLPKNKSIEIVPSSDESYFKLIHHRALDYDE